MMVTRRQADRIVEAVRTEYANLLDVFGEPYLAREWSNAPWSVVWAGPFEWPTTFAARHSAVDGVLVRPGGGAVLDLVDLD